MRPINIYALTRVSDIAWLERLERQMSGRNRYLKIKPWEVEGLRLFCDRLGSVSDMVAEFNFYYSFTMPKLGKEFDLLRVNEDCVINVELKSGNVTDEVIRRQLLQNRYYLALLGKNMYFYTYVSRADRLVRLSHGGRLIEAEWEELAELLVRQTNCYVDSIENYFKEDQYLISPLSDPGRFLRREYFLTAQQREIKKQILKTIQKRKREPVVMGFTGLPGTGKTLLLYDIAMKLSCNEKVCVFHFGSHEEGLEHLNKRLKRVDFYYCSGGELNTIPEKYAAVLVDEGHRIDEGVLKDILARATEWRAPVIFSYDREDAIAEEERRKYGAGLIEKISCYIKYRLTNRIRMNSELSSFINRVMSPYGRNHRREFPSVSISYAETKEEAQRLLEIYQKEGYVYIWDDKLGERALSGLDGPAVGIGEATCKEFEKVVMLMNASFVYDDSGYLRRVSIDAGKEDFCVKNLFHGLSRAKKKIAVVVCENEPVFDELLYVLQGNPGLCETMRGEL